MSQEAKEEAKEQRAKRVARLQDEKDADRKRECELQREARCRPRRGSREEGTARAGENPPQLNNQDEDVDQRGQGWLDANKRRRVAFLGEY